jgi:hypothetical protein
MKFLSAKPREEDEEATPLTDEENAYEKARCAIDQTLGRLPAEPTV